MQHIDIILFTLFVIAIFACAIAMFKYVKLTEEYCNNEDNNGLYNFITIKDNIINVDHIISVKRIESIKDENYQIIIELDDNKEPIIFYFDDDDDIECNYVFEQIHEKLYSAKIAIN